MRNRNKVIIAACTIALLSAGCEHKELCLDHAHYATVYVDLNWELAPDAAPDYMETYFFPTDGGKALRFGFTQKGGGVIEVPFGTYHVLCLNTGTPTNLLRNSAAWDLFEVYTRNASLLEGMGMMTASEPPQAEGAENESGALEPDMLWTARVENVNIPISEALQTVTMFPEQSVTKFSLIIRNADNLEHASGLSGTLSGLSRGYFVGSDVMDDECVTVPFAVQRSGEASLIGNFRGFGHCPNGDDGTPHKLVIYAILEDGTKWYYTFDVTEQVHTAADQRNISIELDRLPLPAPIINGGGVQPDIDEWEDVEVDIPM